MDENFCIFNSIVDVTILCACFTVAILVLRQQIHFVLLVQRRKDVDWVFLDLIIDPSRRIRFNSANRRLIYGEDIRIFVFTTDVYCIMINK